MPTVRVRQGQQGAATTTATSHTTDYTGTRLDQGERLGIILSKVFLFSAYFKGLGIKYLEGEMLFFSIKPYERKYSTFIFSNFSLTVPK